jgi:hypothetical protein
MNPGSPDIIRRTQRFWGGKLGRAVSEKEAAEMVLVAKQFLDLLRSSHKCENCIDTRQNEEETGCDQSK